MSQVNDYNNYQNSLQQMQDSYDTERTESRANNEKLVERQKKEAEERLEKTKKELSARLDEERQQARDEVQKLKEDLYTAQGKQSSQTTKDQLQDRKDFTQYREDVKKEADDEVTRANERTLAQAAKFKDSEDNTVETAVSRQKKSDSTQIHDLEQELEAYRSSNRDLDSERAKARQSSVAENEKGNTDEKKRIIESYERQIAALQEHQEELGEHYNRQLNSAIMKSSHEAQTQVGNQKHEFSQIQRDNELQRNNLERSYQNQIDNLKTSQTLASNNLIEQNRSATDRALSNKDQTYQNYIGQKDAKYKYDVTEKDAKIQELSTTGDQLKVSPYLVKKINDSADQRNYALLLEAQSVHDKNLTAERDRDTSERQQQFQQNQEALTTAHRSMRREMDVQNRQLGDSYKNMQEGRQSEVENITEKNRLQSERTYLQHARELENAQKVKQDALEDQRDVLMGERNASVDDVESKRQNQDREWFLKTNELRRGFETQINEAKDQHDTEVKNIRMEYDKKLRDQTRVSKRDLDDRVRSYEHLITQQALSFKEKERFLTERYEEQLDTMKRTNAHLIEKKS